MTRRIASEDGKVAIADVDAEAGAALMAEVGADRAHFVHCDVRSAATGARAAPRAWSPPVV